MVYETQQSSWGVTSQTHPALLAQLSISSRVVGYTTWFQNVQTRISSDVLDKLDCRGHTGARAALPQSPMDVIVWKENCADPG